MLFSAYGLPLYIDPGTGSMLITIVIGIVTALVFSLRGILANLQLHLSGNGSTAENTDSQIIPCVIFCENKRYWNVFKPICDELEYRQIEADYWTMSADDPALECGYKYVHCVFIGEGQKGFARLNLMKCRICLSTTPGLDVYQWKRSRQAEWYVHIFHQIDDGTVYKMFGLDFYDAVLGPNKIAEEKLRKIEAARGIPEKEYTVVGSTYMDAMAKRFQTVSHKVGKDPVTVLVAPSWGRHALLSKYGEKLIQSLLKTGYKIIIRPHPQSFQSEKAMVEKLQQQFPESEKLSWNRDTDNFAVLCRADVMISDFSAVVFDYSFIFHKPVIFAESAFDKSQYDAAWLEGSIWTLEILPKIGVKLEDDSFTNIKEVIDRVLEDKIYQEGIDCAIEQGWFNRGQSAKLVVDYLTGKLKELEG